ncbi:hypothetical protein GOV06_02635 [Candidatus Woesearchaeota archaeon]|nr:hypothetical protein [Candidatus Woesearchaeota archaeon]
MSIEAVLEFEDKEQDRFLDEFYPIDNIKFYFGDNIHDSQYQILRSETKKGIKKGLEEFLEDNAPELKSIYFGDWDILSDFVYNDDTAKNIKLNISKLEHVDKAHIEEYGTEVCKSYGLFLYQNSFRKFKGED